MRTIALLVTASLTLISCRNDRPTPLPGPPQGGRCDASRAQMMVGSQLRPNSIRAAKRLSRARVGRVLLPGQVVTMEYRADRVNLQVDGRRTIINIRCG